MKHGDSDSKKILFQTCYKCKCNFVPIFFIFLFPQSFEALSERAVAVVVDPIQSVKGKVRVFRFTLWKTVQTLVKKNLGWELSWTIHTCDTVISYMYVCCTAVKRVFAQENAIYQTILVQL